MFDYFWVPASCGLICLVVLLVLRPCAVKIGLVDSPGGRKRHVGDVPLIGGVAVLVAVWIGSLMYLRTFDRYVALYAGVTLLAIVGLVDDLRGMRPLTKLAFQFFAAILMTSWGNVYLSSLGDLFGRREIDLLNWGIPLTIFAALAVVNALNMSDGLDGLAGGLSVIVLAWMAYLAAIVGNMMVLRIAVIFCGALVGFLLLNVNHPLRGARRVFLGDAGSLLLGYVMVWFAVELSQIPYNPAGHVPPVVMLWVLGLILVDLMAVVLRRMIKGRNPLAADRTHLHHVLVRLGLSPTQVVCVIWFANALFGLVGVAAWRLGMPEQWIFLLFLAISASHFLMVRNAWKLLRMGRKFTRKQGAQPGA
ncbi:MraY family glycosyltransferase [Cupriavidus sp. D384]|uniref:MraY family glycosyltransferase n=1 Tax=Cupriavidus sp. D384 TaxID=1538095 RepID=UPI00083529FA|nr:MraY family glycosyltransferase [Cupriavidus sp. D384]